jgi:ankyrin repeat protein
MRESLLAARAAQAVPLDVFEAAAIGDLPSLQSVLAATPDSVNEFSSDGWTALHLAAGFGTPGAVAALLFAGADVHAFSRNPQKNQPLHAAVALGKNPDIVNLLLANGAQVNTPQAGGFAPLFSAAAADCRPLAEVLIAHGADPAQKSDAGKTAADFARERDHLQMAAWLESL